jgi:citrate synthase
VRGSKPTRVQPEFCVDNIIAKALGISVKNIHKDLSYQSIPQWDSLRHIALMLAIEEAAGVSIEQDLIPVLEDVSAIRAFFSQTEKNRQEMDQKSTTDNKKNKLNAIIERGLTNIHLDNTLISRVEGDDGILEYRGYSIHDLVAYSTFEEVAYLLMYGDLPDAHKLQEYITLLAHARRLPPPVLNLIHSMRDAHPMDALRTAVSALSVFDPSLNGAPDNAEPPKCLQLLAKVPIIIGAHHAGRSGRKFVFPQPDLSFAEYFLHALLQRPPAGPEIRLMDKDLILHADLAANPSAFAARIAISCNAGICAAITAAISAFAGPLHGGAAEQALKMIDDIGEPGRAASYVAGCWARNEPVMGFGHRVFRADPRVRHFREAALHLSHEQGDMREFNVLEAVAEAMKPYARLGANPNVDLYAGLIYRKLGLPGDLTVPIFVAGRMAGWLAQAAEQDESNVLIYPLLNYVGPAGRTYQGAGTYRA